MPEIDIKTYQKKAVAMAAERVLITQERSQKLDLLIHLLSNLRQSLIVCGPKGIGKTTLLNTLLQNRQDEWRICLLQADPALGLAAMLSGLGDFLFPGVKPEADAAVIADFCKSRKVVLIIDDAELLSPGVLTELLAFGESVPELGLVMAMTHDGFNIKRSTDKAIDDCHFIELPPLTQKECAEYLQNLSSLPGIGLSFKAITDSLVADLYRLSHGIPGRIMVELPKVNQLHQSRSAGRNGAWLGIVLAVSVVSLGGYLLKTQPDGQLAENSPVIHELVLPTIKPVVPPEVNTVGQTESTPDKAISVPEPVVSVAQNVESAPRHQDAPSPVKATIATVEQLAPPPATVVETVKSAAVSKAGNPAQEGSQAWIMKQPADNYTLQVMVLYDQDAVNRVFKKYAVYADNLKYFVNNAKNKHKYVVIYGSFQSLAEARKHKSTMPNEFTTSLEKRFKFVQNESR
jgi:DamX protein